MIGIAEGLANSARVLIVLVPLTGDQNDVASFRLGNRQRDGRCAIRFNDRADLTTALKDILDDGVG